MQAQIHQLRCPTCNASQNITGGPTYECPFCRTQFSLEAAEAEQEKLLDQLKGWVVQTLGVRDSGGAQIDYGTRSRIFRQEIYPSLAAEVERTLESFDPFGHGPLIKTPLAHQTGRGKSHPLVKYRDAILALKALRMRLSDGEVQAFAMQAEEQWSLKYLDHRLSLLMGITNLVHATAQNGDPKSYLAAAKNVQQILKEIADLVSADGCVDESKTAFLTLQVNVFQSLMEYCQACGHLGELKAQNADWCGQRFRGIGADLQAVAHKLERCEQDPVACMALAYTLKMEMAECASVADWLGVFAMLDRVGDITFPEFLNHLFHYGGRNKADALGVAQTICETIQAKKGERSVQACPDFSWTTAWIDKTRRKPLLGLMGSDESVTREKCFFLPVWLCKVSHARRQKGVFSQKGVEETSLLLVSAIDPGPELVLLSNAADDWHGELQPRQSLKGKPVALPNSSAGEVKRMLAKAIPYKFPKMLNARIEEDPEMVFLPAVSVTYANKGSDRDASACKVWDLAFNSTVLDQVKATEQLLQRFA